MDYSQVILAVNAASIAILILFAMLLLSVSRFKGMNGYAALIAIVPTVPVYLYNMSRMLEWHGMAMFMLPFSFTVNVTLMPLLWLFTKGNFDPSFRWDIRKAVHFIPMTVFLVLILTMSQQEKMDMILYEMTGKDNWFGNLNSSVVLIQVIGYFTAIFVYIGRVRKRIADTASDAEWLQKLWVRRFMILFCCMFVVVEVCYTLWPRTDAWLIQITNVIIMSYLVYHSLTHPQMPMNRIDQVQNEGKSAKMPGMSQEEMKKVCERAESYLTESRAYLRPDITLAEFAKEAGIQPRTLSQSVNGYLNVNFFDFINRKRVEKAKELLLGLKTTDYSIDSIFEECGFRSRSTFFLVFKKMEGKSPAAWLDNAVRP